MQLRTPRIRQHPGGLSAKECDLCTNIALLVPAERTSVRSLPHGEALAERMRRAGYKLGDAKPFVTDLPNRHGTRLSLAGVKPDASSFEILTLARKLVAAHADSRPERLALVARGFDAGSAQALEALTAAALAADFELPHFKSGPDESRPLKELALYGALPAATLARTLAGALGNNLARYLTALPPNELTPASYRKRVAPLAKRYRWKSEFWDVRKLTQKKAGAFLAVAQGSPEPDAGILHLSYTPKKKRRPGIALVGKGICFDTGGTNLKPARYMHGMHGDMQGSAVALGTLLALTELNVDFPVDCWLALAQNHIGPKAYRQNEVVRAANGTSIEVMHTDAEGRMVLADTLYFASQTKPELLIDYATLTGVCKEALSTRMSGAVTNRPALVPTLIQAGEESGERIWPFPMPPDYAEALKSEVADVKQCILENDADQILAAVFLRRFLAHDPAWVHIDMSAGEHKGGLAHVPSDVTGFGVRFSLHLLLDQWLQEEKQ